MFLPQGFQSIRTVASGGVTSARVQIAPPFDVMESRVADQSGGAILVSSVLAHSTGNMSWW